jgi:hypothetical protein
MFYAVQFRPAFSKDSSLIGGDCVSRAKSAQTLCLDWPVASASIAILGICRCASRSVITTRLHAAARMTARRRSPTYGF